MFREAPASLKPMGDTSVYTNEKSVGSDSLEHLKANWHLCTFINFMLRRPNKGSEMQMACDFPQGRDRGRRSSSIVGWVLQPLGAYRDAPLRTAVILFTDLSHSHIPHSAVTPGNSLAKGEMLLLTNSDFQLCNLCPALEQRGNSYQTASPGGCAHPSRLSRDQIPRPSLLPS